MAKRTGIISNLVICVSLTLSKSKRKDQAFGSRTTPNTWIDTRRSLKSKSIQANLVKAVPGVVGMASAGGRATAVALPGGSQAGINSGGNHSGLHSTFCEIQPLLILRTQQLTCFEIRGRLAITTFRYC